MSDQKIKMSANPLLHSGRFQATAILASVAIATAITVGYLSSYTPQDETDENRRLILKAEPQSFITNPITSLGKLFAPELDDYGCPTNSLRQSPHDPSVDTENWKLLDTAKGCGNEARLGYSVGLSTKGSKTMIVTGSPGHMENKDKHMGRGFMESFVVDGSNKLQTLGRIEGDAVGDMFGFSVAISAKSERAIGGAPMANNEKGYVKFATSDCKKQIIKVKGKNEGQQFGHAVAINRDGTRFAVTGPALSSSERTGIMGVFDDKGNELVQFKSNARSDGFGYSLSMDETGKYIAVGAPQGNYVAIFKDTGNDKWKEMDSIFHDDNERNDDYAGADTRFGHSVSLTTDKSGNLILAVGVPSRGNRDFVQVYMYKNGKWSPRGDKIEGDYFDFGASVALTPDGNWISVGDPEFDQDGQQARGRTCIFRYNYSKNRWDKQGQDLLGAGSFDNTGYASAIAGDKCNDVVVAVASPFAEPNDFQSGTVNLMQYQL